MDVNDVISLKDKAETFFKSRWSGLLLGPTYGVLLYLYISYMILHGLPFTPDHMDFSVSEQDHQINNTQQFLDADCSVEGLLNKIFTKAENKTMNKVISNKDGLNPFYKTNASQTCQPMMTVKTRYSIRY